MALLSGKILVVMICITILVSIGNAEETNRAFQDTCEDSIVINQGLTAPLPSGIPTFTVRISNICAKYRNISGIHLHWEAFSSALLINPRVFKRISYDDCIVKDGGILINGETVSFQYEHISVDC